MSATALALRAQAPLSPAALHDWTAEQKALIRNTCFPDANDDELAMYLHIAAKSGLDPLRKQLHASRIGGRLSFVADINGLQARAAREPDYRGLPCGVIYEGDDFLWDALEGRPVKHHSTLKGRPVGAWAVVEREGMKPFASLVRFDEYNNPRNGLWREKPGVMILKVAKSTALRLAYPEQLGGVYERAELDKATRDGVSMEDTKPESHFSPEAVRLADAAAKPSPAMDVVKAQVLENLAAIEAPPPSPEAPKKPRGPTDAALRARVGRLWKKLEVMGMKREEFPHWAAGILGWEDPRPSSEWTPEDVEHLETAVQAEDALRTVEGKPGKQD